MLKNKNLQSWKMLRQLLQKVLLNKEEVQKRQRQRLSKKLLKTKKEAKQKTRPKMSRKKKRRRRLKRKKKKQSHFLPLLLWRESLSRSIVLKTTMLTLTSKFSTDLTSLANISKHCSLILTHLWLILWKCVKLTELTAVRWLRQNF